ncbi:MAG: hypothetical protein WBM62_04255, partial [Crocosphaera sp.]
MIGNLHLVSGEKRGVGSSLFCRALIDYCQHNELSNLVIIDGEINQVIGKTYAPKLYQTSSDSPLTKIQFDSKLKYYQLDVLLDLAISDNQVIVNVPSRSFSIIDDWLNPVDLEELADAYSVKVWRWFTTDGSAESIDILKKSYRLYGDTINHVIVKNQGDLRNVLSSWTLFNKDQQLQSYLQASQTTYSLMMPTVPMANFCWDIIRQKQLTFT